MKTLKALAGKAPSAKALIHDLLSKPGKDRSKQVVHASDLTNEYRKFCAREVVLTRMFKLPPSEQQVVAAAMRMTWDEGRDRQWRINNHYLRDHLIGVWRCRTCGLKSSWGKFPNKGMGIYHTPCPAFPHKWEYTEPFFRHPSGFTGSLDGVIDFGLPKYRMLECKIMKADDFRTLKAPLAEHRVRTRLYLRLIADSSSAKAQTIDSSVAHVLYFMRGHGVKDETGTISPIKEFLVTRDDAEIEQYVLSAWGVQAAMEGGTTPHGICSSLFEKRATACPVAKQCFSGRYPPGEARVE